MLDHIGLIAGRNPVLLKEGKVAQFPLANDPLKVVRKKHSVNDFSGARSLESGRAGKKWWR